MSGKCQWHRIFFVSQSPRRHRPDLVADHVSFEAFDEPWKQEFGGVEPYWGMFDSERNLKNITIPTCS